MGCHSIINCYESDTVYSMCVGCGGQNQQGRRVTVGEELWKLFWPAHLLCQVDSNHYIGQSC